MARRCNADSDRQSQTVESVITRDFLYEGCCVHGRNGRVASKMGYNETATPYDPSLALALHVENDAPAFVLFGVNTRTTRQDSESQDRI